MILFVVLAVAGVFSGGDGDSTSGSNGGGSSQTASNEGPPRAELSAQDGSDAQGVAVFGRLRQVPVLQVTGFSLDPTPDGQSYAIWLRSSNQLSVPLGRTKVTGTGRLQVRLQIPTQILQYVGDRTITSGSLACFELGVQGRGSAGPRSAAAAPFHGREHLGRSDHRIGSERNRERRGLLGLGTSPPWPAESPGPASQPVERPTPGPPSQKSCPCSP